MRFVFSKNTIEREPEQDDLVKAGVGFGREAGTHKYKRRVRVFRHGHLEWQYYYDDPKERAKQIEEQARAFKHQQDKLKEIEDRHKKMADFRPDHPEIAAARKLLKELSAEYVQSILTWERPPKLKISDAVKETYHEAVTKLYDGGQTEPEDPHGKPLSVYRATEMAFERMPPSIKKHFSGAISSIDFLHSKDDELFSSGMAAGYCEWAKENGSRIAIGVEHSFKPTAFAGHHMKGGLWGAEVLIHEMAHAIHNQIGAKGRGRTQEGFVKPDGGKYKDHDHETWDGPSFADFEKFMSGPGKGEKAITEYANKDVYERWAESFTCALMYPKQLAMTAPKMYEWFHDFFGEGGMRPLRTDDNLIRSLKEKRDAALKANDTDTASKLSKQMDAAIGVLDMADDDRRLQWWLPAETKVQKVLREQIRPNYHGGSVVIDAADKFYEVSVGGRSVYMRVGWNGNPDEPFSGWTPDKDTRPKGQRIGLRNSEIKEVYDEHGKPLAKNAVWWHLHQDQLPDDHEKAQGLLSFTTEGASKKPIEPGPLTPGTEGGEQMSAEQKSALATNKALVDNHDPRHWLGYMAQRFESGKATDGDKKAQPVEISAKDFRQRSGTFTFDQFRVSGEDEMNVLRNSDNEAERNAAIESLKKKQPYMAREPVYSPKGRIMATQPIFDQDPTTGRMVPRLHTVRYENTNPDGTKSVIECTRDKDGRFYINNPMWAALLTPDGEDIKSHEDLINKCRAASEAAQGDPPKPRRAWVSIRTDAKGGDTEHFYHVEVEFDGRGQPKVIGDTWKRRLEKDEPRLDDLLRSTTRPQQVINPFSDLPGATTTETPEWETERAAVVAEKIKLEPKRKAVKGEMPELGARTVLSVSPGDLKKIGINAIEGKEVVTRLVRMLPGKKAGVVPSPPGWDRMPEDVAPFPTEGEAAGNLRAREKKLVEDGLLPPDYKGSKEQRAWLKDVFEPAYKEWEATKDEVTAQEIPPRYIFVGEVGSGNASGKTFVRIGEDEVKKTTRRPAVSRKPMPLKHDLLAYAHTEVDPITGQATSEEVRLILPSDGSIAPADLENMPGVTVTRGPGVDLGFIKLGGGVESIRVNVDGFAQLRKSTGGMSLTSEAEQIVRKKIETLKTAVAAEKVHKIQLDDIDPAKLKEKGIGVVSHMPNGAPFELALHQKELIQKLIDNNGRALGAHYMGCVSGRTAVMLAQPNPDLPARVEARGLTQLAEVFKLHEAGRPLFVEQLNQRGAITYGEVEKAWYAGPKETAELRLADGRALRATPNHLFWVDATVPGWREHRMLRRGDRVATAGPGRVEWIEVTAAMQDPRSEDTYDLTMKDPRAPSYAANGMIVHNTGKTISAIVAAKTMMKMEDPDNPGQPHPQAPKKVLIVAPLNTVEQWRQACGDFDDGCTVVGAGKNDIPAKDYLNMVKEGRDTSDIVVVGPEYWTLNQAKLREAGFDGLIVDEAHMGLKNEKTARNKALHSWNADMKMLMLLTGTPVTVSPADWMEYVKLLSKGEHWDGMSRAQFIEEFLEECPVPQEFGVKGRKGPKTQVKASKREELSGILANWVHIATPKDVREKTLPAVRIEESKHAHMVGTQSILYAIKMAALSEGDLDSIKAGGVLSGDEAAGLDEDKKRELSAAKAIANCHAYKPKSDEKWIMTYDPVIQPDGKTGKKRVEFRTFDPEWLMTRPDIAKVANRKKFAGRWPAIDEMDVHRAMLYTVHFQELLGKPYEELAGTKITEEQLAKIKADNWPRGLQNPDHGPLGIRCRGRDEPKQWEDPTLPQRAAEFQRVYATVLQTKIPMPTESGKMKYVYPDPETAKLIAARQYGIDEDTAHEYLHTRPDATDHFSDVEYGGVTVNEGDEWVSDTRGSLHLLYRKQDWDEDAARPRSTGGFEKVKDGDRVEVSGDHLDKFRPKEIKKGEWEPPTVRYDATLGENKKGEVAVRSMEDGSVIWVPKDAISAYTPSLMDPGMRGERAKADVAMFKGNAKAEELMAHIEQFSPDSSKGEGGTRQMVLFGNGILESCRTMEATLRTAGYRDVNEVLAGSPHHDPTDPTTRDNTSPNGKYFVTFIGATYTGNRDLNIEIFKKTKDKLGRDSDVSLFVDKMKNGVDWRPYPSAEKSAIKVNDWSPETREQIHRQFKLKVPEAYYVSDKGEQRYFYGTKESESIRRQIILAGDPARMADPAVAETTRQLIATLQTKYEKMVKDQSTTTPPLKPREEHVFNNCDLIVCSDAAQVGMNLGNSVEMVMYDSLGSPMAEWQRITRCARMLPPSVHADLMGKPVYEQALDDSGQPAVDEKGEPIMKLKFDENGKAMRDGTGPFAKIKAMEAQLFDPGNRGTPEGHVTGLKGFFSSAGSEPMNITASQALNMIAAEASSRAFGDDGAAWAAIAARARVGANLGLNATRAALDELKEMREPGSKNKLLSFTSLQIPDPIEGTYMGGEEINPPEGAIRAAIDNLSDSEKEQIRKAGFVKADEAGSIDGTAVYLALRAQEVFDYIETQRPQVAASLRASSAGAIITDADVMNVIIDSLTPMDKAILKSKKYLVNVRRIGVSANVPQMVKVKMKDEDGKDVNVNVFAGFEKEYPVTTERNTRAMGRARMIPYEQMLYDIQHGVGIRRAHEYEMIGAEHAAAISRKDLNKAQRYVLPLGGNRAR